MKIFLYCTELDCFRPPAVLERIREGLRAGNVVAISTRDHPETLPEGTVHAGDDWSAVAAARPAMAVLDNLLFADRTGRILYRWDEEQERHRADSGAGLEHLLHALESQGTREVLLVCEGPEVSPGWSDWMRRRGVIGMDPDPDRDPAYCRNWFLAVGRDDGSGYRYCEGRLLKRAERGSGRVFEAHVRDPRSEVLLALVGEFVALMYEYDNPDDPRALNRRDDMIHEIIQAYGCTGDPRDLLFPLEDLYDRVSEHVDFSRPRRGRGGTGK